MKQIITLLTAPNCLRDKPSAQSLLSTPNSKHPELSELFTTVSPSGCTYDWQPLSAHQEAGSRSLPPQMASQVPSTHFTYLQVLVQSQYIDYAYN